MFDWLFTTQFVAGDTVFVDIKSNQVGKGVVQTTRRRGLKLEVLVEYKGYMLFPYKEVDVVKWFPASKVTKP